MRRRAVYRLIPAHAGKTGILRASRSVITAHPRSRGENADDARVFGEYNGSSPLTRGKPSTASWSPTRTRLIPAHAGKTRLSAGQQRGGAAHPRSRGENLIVWSIRLFNCGSSPLTRGKPVRQLARVRDRRLIPAHAGKTCRRGGASTRRRAHPRSRGEHVPTNQRLGRRSGSSPLTRGTRPRRDARRYRRRLIPAHAGNTGGVPVWHVGLAAHPRSRGEHAGSAADCTSTMGSSPLTRGTLVVLRLIMRCRGLIPAHAGNTAPRAEAARPGTAHPRSRGEHLRFPIGRR